MYLRRKIDDFLKEWKKDVHRLPLIVKGARQVGKTASVLHFANSTYGKVIYINFALEKKYLNIISDGYDVNSIIRNITLLDPGKIFEANDTVIIFDEIQECPDIATALKSFSIDGRYDVICSGSMLGINYKKIHSNSVGYKTDYEMHSFDFEEFLWAKGYGQDTVDSILSHMLEMRCFSDAEIYAYKTLFLDYCILGGMPAVISRYIENDSFSGTMQIQKQIHLD